MPEASKSFLRAIQSSFDQSKGVAKFLKEEKSPFQKRASSLYEEEDDEETTPVHDALDVPMGPDVEDVYDGTPEQAAIQLVDELGLEATIEHLEDTDDSFLKDVLDAIDTVQDAVEEVARGQESTDDILEQIEIVPDRPRTRKRRDVLEGIEIVPDSEPSISRELREAEHIADRLLRSDRPSRRRF